MSPCQSNLQSAEGLIGMANTTQHHASEQVLHYMTMPEVCPYCIMHLVRRTRVGTSIILPDIDNYDGKLSYLLQKKLSVCYDMTLSELCVTTQRNSDRPLYWYTPSFAYEHTALRNQMQASRIWCEHSTVDRYEDVVF